MLLRSKNPSPSDRSIRQAGTWAVMGRLGGRVLDFVSLVVLARLLTPDDFGLVAMAMTVALFLEAATQIPITQPIIRADEPEPGHYDTSFTLGLARSLVLAGIVVVSAPAVAGFFGEGRLVPLLWFLALGPVFRGMVSPRITDFTRAYDMRPDLVMTVGGKLVAMLVVVGLAVRTGSYWAIAAGSVATPLVICFLSYVIAPYRPHISLAKWSEFSDVVGWGSLDRILSALDFQLDKMVLGRMIPAAEFGRYSLARDLASMPIQVLVVPLEGPLLTGFARARAGGRQGRDWLEALNGVVLVAGSALLALAILSDVAVQLLLGSAWLDASPYLALLALSLIPGLPKFVLGPLAINMHRADLSTKRTAVNLTLGVPLMVMGVALGGIFGGIAGRATGNLAGTLFTLHGARQLTGLSIGHQLWAMHRTMVGLLSFAAAVALLVPHDDAAGGVSGLALVWLVLMSVLAVAGGFVVLLAATVGLWLAEGRPPGVEQRLVPVLAWVRARRSRSGRV